MPILPKSKQPHKFDGTKAVYYDAMSCPVCRLMFMVTGDDLAIQQFGYKNKKYGTVTIKDFKQKTLQKILAYHDPDDTNRMLQDGTADIWLYYGLPLGYIQPISRLM